MPDANLVTALKMAKGKPMFFAFVGKGSDGKLIVSKAKITSKQIDEAKKEVGGGTPVKGTCSGEFSNMVFQVAKAPSPTLAPTLKKIIHRDAGLTIIPTVQVGGASDEDEEDTAAPAPASAAAGTAAPGAPPAPPGQGNVLGIQKALQKLGYDPGKTDGVMGPHTQAAIKKFQQANGLAADGIVGPKTQAALAKALQGGAAAGGAQAPPVPPKVELPAEDAASKDAAAFDLSIYQASRQTVINGLKALAGKVAGTKHGSAAGVLKEINSIITKLPANPAANELQKLRDFIANDDAITAAEEVPDHFHDLDIREPLLKAWKK